MNRFLRQALTDRRKSNMHGEHLVTINRQCGSSHIHREKVLPQQIQSSKSGFWHIHFGILGAKKFAH